MGLRRETQAQIRRVEIKPKSSSSHQAQLPSSEDDQKSEKKSRKRKKEKKEKKSKKDKKSRKSSRRNNDTSNESDSMEEVEVTKKTVEKQTSKRIVRQIAPPKDHSDEEHSNSESDEQKEL